MTLRSTLEQFRTEARAIAAAVPKEWKDRAVRLGEFAYEALIQATEDSGSVDTGAYRAEHVVEQAGAPLFEHPNRPGDVEYPSQKAIGAGPIFDAAEASAVGEALDSRLAVDGFGFVNRRHYAGNLEYGSATIEPRQIYARARDATAAYADALAQEGLRRPELK